MFPEHSAPAPAAILRQTRVRLYNRHEIMAIASGTPGTQQALRSESGLSPGFNVVEYRKKQHHFSRGRSKCVIRLL